MEAIDEGDLSLLLVRKFLSGEQECAALRGLQALPWFRVKYESHRFGNACETPCWTNYFGGVHGIEPWQPIPEFLQALADEVRSACGKETPKFNSVLVRLYLDGNDNIAWHTDGRTFLGTEPIIGSLSLGAPATFEMRRMHDVWPKPGSGAGCAVDTSVPLKSWKLCSGDLLVMRGTTQQHWHHRVPREKYRGPRFNVNFRYIIPGQEDTERGIKTFYKYMVHGDESMETARGMTYAEILSQRAPILALAHKRALEEETSGRGECGGRAPEKQENAIATPGQLKRSNTSHFHASHPTCAPIATTESSREEDDDTAALGEDQIAPAGKKPKRCGSPKRAEARQSFFTWTCLGCTFENVEVLAGYGRQCNMCHSPRPGPGCAGLQSAHLHCPATTSAHHDRRRPTTPSRAPDASRLKPRAGVGKAAPGFFSGGKRTGTSIAAYFRKPVEGGGVGGTP